MIKMIAFLEQNKYVVQLLKEGKLCLVGMDTDGERAILRAYEEAVILENRYWR